MTVSSSARRPTATMTTWRPSEPVITAADQRDYAVELNKLLQRHPTGNLTKYFRYILTKEGRDDAPTHIAIARFRDVVYAAGRGQSKGAAKRDAAKQVYENFSQNGVPVPEPPDEEEPAITLVVSIG